MTVWWLFSLLTSSDADRLHPQLTATSERIRCTRTNPPLLFKRGATNERSLRAFYLRLLCAASVSLHFLFFLFLPILSESRSKRIRRWSSDSLSSVKFGQSFKKKNEIKSGREETCSDFHVCGVQILTVIPNVHNYKIGLRQKSSSSEQNEWFLKKQMRWWIKSGGCSYLCLLPSSADYPGSIMLTHFTVPAPNSVLLQVSESSPSRDRQTGRRTPRLPPAPFRIRRDSVGTDQPEETTNTDRIEFKFKI